MNKAIPILAAIAAVAAFVFLVIMPGRDEPITTTPAATVSPQAVETSPRPQVRECAGTVTNNPAILAWRREMGC